MKQIRLSKGLFALVSPEDYEWLSQNKWTATFGSAGEGRWYAIRRNGRETAKLRMHREVAMRMNGIEWIGNKLVVDHINGNSLDNRRENLEIVTQRENMRRSKMWEKSCVK